MKLIKDDGIVDLQPGATNSLISYGIGNYRPWDYMEATNITSMSSVVLGSFQCSEAWIDDLHYGDIYKYSDMNTKRDIKSTTVDVSSLNQLKVVDFEYIDSLETNKKLKGKNRYIHLPQGAQTGFIAQDMQEVLPNLVKLDPTTQMLTNNEVGLIPYLVKAYQEQQLINQNFESKIKELQNEILLLKGSVKPKNATIEGK